MTTRKFESGYSKLQKKEDLKLPRAASFFGVLHVTYLYFIFFFYKRMENFTKSYT